ncbi:MAG: hypothetical protein RB191_15845 [Terriglobia bacterium]|nr:hypothetical protein [Terriglobia bacterium]
MSGPLPRKKPKVSVGAARKARVSEAPEAASIKAAPADGSRLPVPDLDGPSVVFGNIKFMPKMADIPEEFHRHSNVFVSAVSTWFFSGAKFESGVLTVGSKRFKAAPGIDANKALRAIKAVLGSWEPKHQEKEAACGYMLSQWFDLQA